jgi:hypothetical protein
MLVAVGEGSGMLLMVGVGAFDGRGIVTVITGVFSKAETQPARRKINNDNDRYRIFITCL